MSIITAMAIYFIFWWITLFAVLPFGLRTQAEENYIVRGTVASAPARPRIWLVFLRTTIVSGIVFFVYWYATEKLGLGLDDIPHFFPDL